MKGIRMLSSVEITFTRNSEFSLPNDIRFIFGMVKVSLLDIAKNGRLINPHSFDRLANITTDNFVSHCNIEC
jgi:hypothetical protein